MIDAPLALAFGAGMVATINPCGFAMLPAYLSFFMGMEDRSADTRASVLRALAVGATVSAGFLVVFGVLGVLMRPFMQSVQQHLPWVTMVIGVLLLVLGVAMLRGFEPVVRLPKMSKGTGSRELPSMFLFGVSYAVSSLSCTIPVFLATVANTFRSSDFVSGVAVFLAYGAGMALVLMALTLAIALARQGMVHRMRRMLPYVGRISGGLLVLAGAYLAYYGWYEIQVYNGNAAPGGPAEAVFRLNGDLADWITRTGPARIGLVLVAVLVLAVVVATAWKGTRRTSDQS